MHTGYISFCDKLGLNIKSEDVKEQIVKELQERFDVKIVCRHHDRLQDADRLQRLKQCPHLVCLRTNGNPYYLYLTRVNGINECMFIDKKVQGGYFLPRIIISKLCFDPSLFDGTLFDGEMIRLRNGESPWLFLLHDIIALRGVSLQNEMLVRRIEKMIEVVNTAWIPDDTDVCTLQVKRYCTFAELDAFLYEFMPTLPYTCRGIYFKPLYRKFIDVLFNFDDTLIKKVQRIKYQQETSFMSGAKIAVLREETRTPILSSDSGSGPSSGSNSGTVSGANTPPRSGLTSMCVSPTASTTPAVLAFGKSLGPIQIPNETSGLRTCILQKTQFVDVYNLADATTKKEMGVATIPNKKMSLQIQHLLKGTTLQGKILVQCSYHERFRKWEPVAIL